MLTSQSLFELIREAQKRRDAKKTEEKVEETPPVAKSDEIITKSEGSRKRPESH